jgi:hypothetical protein
MCGDLALLPNNCQAATGSQTKSRHARQVTANCRRPENWRLVIVGRPVMRPPHRRIAKQQRGADCERPCRRPRERGKRGQSIISAQSSVRTEWVFRRPPVALRGSSAARRSRYLRRAAGPPLRRGDVRCWRPRRRSGREVGGVRHPSAAAATPWQTSRTVPPERRPLGRRRAPLRRSGGAVADVNSASAAPQKSVASRKRCLPSARWRRQSARCG